MWPRARRLCTNELHLLHSLWLKTDCAISACQLFFPRHAGRLKHCYRARLQTDLPHSRGRPRGLRAVQCMASKPSGSAAVEGKELLLRAATAWVSFTVRAAVRVEIRAWRNAVLWAARTLPDRQAFRRLLLEGRQRRAEERITAQLGPVPPQPAEQHHVHDLLTHSFLKKAMYSFMPYMSMP